MLVLRSYRSAPHTNSRRAAPCLHHVGRRSCRTPTSHRASRWTHCTSCPRHPCRRRLCHRRCSAPHTTKAASCPAHAASLTGVLLVPQVRRPREDSRLGAAQRQPRRLPARGLRSRRAQDHHVHVQWHARREAGGQGRPVSVVSIATVSTAIVARREGKGDRSAAPQVGT